MFSVYVLPCYLQNSVITVYICIALWRLQTTFTLWYFLLHWMWMTVSWRWACSWVSKIFQFWVPDCSSSSGHCFEGRSRVSRVFSVSIYSVYRQKKGWKWLCRFWFSLCLLYSRNESSLASTLKTLLFFTALMITVPIGLYFTTKSYVFEGNYIFVDILL